jgi:KaiC/GvpD/RAD55 family RecA-like ATPase
MSFQPLLRFGIPSLDELMGGKRVEASSPSRPYDHFGVSLEETTTSICIMGPDGTGKSILGLHLASRYVADSNDWWLNPFRDEMDSLSSEIENLMINGDPNGDPNESVQKRADIIDAVQKMDEENQKSSKLLGQICKDVSASIEICRELGDRKNWRVQDELSELQALLTKAHDNANEVVKTRINCILNLRKAINYLKSVQVTPDKLTARLQETQAVLRKETIKSQKRLRRVTDHFKEIVELNTVDAGNYAREDNERLLALLEKVLRLLHEPQAPFVLYVSTDLLYRKAKQIWRAFKLNQPDTRKIPHTFSSDNLPYDSESLQPRKFTLRETLPPGHKPLKNESEEYPEPISIEDYLDDPTIPGCESKKGLSDEERENLRNAGGVAFLDLAAHTAGDDWAYVNRILSLLPEREGNEPKHLMIIDAIEGLEVLTGERDAFGERRSRRSRIAQLVRSAAGKCHLAFVVEEMRDGQRLAEEFVADLVIRLHSETKNGYAERTLEVVKSRAQAHHRKPHDYTIRSGNPSRTGVDQNPDEPHVENAYFHVHHGVDTLFHSIAAQKDPVITPSAPLPTFGIRYLDHMLGHSIEGSPTQSESKTPLSSQPNMTALIGDVSTFKSSLGYAFLSECFSESSFYKWPTQEISPRQSDLEKLPVAVLLTTHLLDAKLLAQRLFLHLPQAEQRFWRGVAIGCYENLSKADKQTAKAKFIERAEKIVEAARPSSDYTFIVGREMSFEGPEFSPYERAGQPHELDSDLLNDLVSNLVSIFIEPRVICRRLPVRDMSSAQFFHIVESAVREARKKIGQFPDQYNKRWIGVGEQLGAIRLVLDDWSTIRSIYPSVAQDTLLLQFLLQYFQWQKLATLVIDTQHGDPETIRRSVEGGDLRALIGRHIYTWHVSFFKEDRVAIAVMPRASDTGGLPVSVRELRPRKGHAAKLSVDPHFESYSGLEQGDPRPLPLRVSFYTGSSGANAYIAETDALLRQFFTGVERGPIVLTESATNYEALRQMANAPRGTRLNCTQIVQVDEFWKHTKDQNEQAGSATESEGTKFCRAYLNARTLDDEGQPTPEDPFELFQPTQAIDEHNELLNSDLPTHSRSTPTIKRFLSKKDRRRHSFFNIGELYYSAGSEQQENQQEGKASETLDTLSMVPMFWDFGFLLCQGRSWLVAKDQKIKPANKPDYRTDPKLETVDDVWKALTKPRSIEQQQVSWFDFLLACRAVAQTETRQGAEETVFAFDVDMHGPSSLSCLILEIWASELFEVTGGKIRLLLLQQKGMPDSAKEVNKEVIQKIFESLFKPDDELAPLLGDSEISVGESKIPFGMAGYLPETITPQEKPKKLPEWCDSLSSDDLRKLKKSLRKFHKYVKDQLKEWKDRSPGDFSPEEKAAIKSWDSNNPAPPDLYYRLLKFWPYVDCEKVFPRWRSDERVAFDKSLIDLLEGPEEGSEESLEEGSEESLEEGLEESLEESIAANSILRDQCRMALFRAMLLICGGTAGSQFESEGFSFPERGAHHSAVAARHWYSTASRAMSNWDAQNPLIPVRLPGHYSVRGDWFLTVADGSQSSHLAKSALDLLSSVRSNMTRMQHGMGLPTRTVYNLDFQRTQLYTIEEQPRVSHKQPLPPFPEETGVTNGKGTEKKEQTALKRHPRHKRRMRYYEVCQLSQANGFHWIWRSRLRNYQRHARIWNYWGLTLIRGWHRGVPTPEYQDINPFDLYNWVRDNSKIALAERIPILPEDENGGTEEEGGGIEPDSAWQEFYSDSAGKDFKAAFKVFREAHKASTTTEAHKPGTTTSELWHPRTIEAAFKLLEMPVGDIVSRRAYINSKSHGVPKEEMWGLWAFDILQRRSDGPTRHLYNNFRNQIVVLNYFLWAVEGLIADLKDATPLDISGDSMQVGNVTTSVTT